MDTVYGLHTRFTTGPGQAEALTAILLAAADGLGANEACLLYLVSRSPQDRDIVWVTEVWTSQAAHDASLQGEAVKRAIQQARPLMADVVSTALRPVGGKGI